MSFNVGRAVELLRVYGVRKGVPKEDLAQNLLEKFLNLAQIDVVNYMLGLAKSNRSVYDMFVGIMATTDISVVSEGYALADLSTTGLMASPDSFIRAEATIDSVKQRCIRRSTEMEGLSQNQYLSGADDYPVLYFENNKIFVEADSGTEPTLTFQYVRQPKTLVTIDPDTDIEQTDCELMAIFERPIFLLAQAELDKFRGDNESYLALRKECFEYLVALTDQGKRDGAVEGQMLRRLNDVAER